MDFIFQWILFYNGFYFSVDFIIFMDYIQWILFYNGFYNFYGLYSMDLMIQWILYFYSRFIHFHDFIHVLVDFSFLWIFIYFPLAS